MMRMATEKQANQRKHNNTKGPGKRVIEATKLNAETRDSPSQDPRDHREQLFSITFTQTLRSKHRQRRVAARVVEKKG